MTVWLIEALVGSTLLMLGVLALRRPVARFCGPRTAYALWTLPGLRMVLPTLPGWTPLVRPWAVAAPAPSGDMTLGLAVGAGPAELAAVRAPHMAAAALPDIAPEPAITLIDQAHLLPVLWLAGGVLWFGWQLLRYRRFVHRALDGASLLTQSGGTSVYVTPAVAGPMAAGVFRRRIFLPVDFRSRYTPAEQRLALLHEGAHHDRGDLVANFIGLGVVALHWWNPVAHIAWRAFRADQELACDATVLAGQGADRAAYGSAVLKSACDRAPTAACAMNQKSQLKKRIAMMKTMPMTLSRRITSALMTAALIGGGLLLTASGKPLAPPSPPEAAAPPAPPAPPLTLAAVSPKAPPAPPAAPAAPSPPTPPAPPAAPSRAGAAADAADAATRAAADAEDAATRAAADAADAATRAAADAEDAATRAAADAEDAAERAAAAAEDGAGIAALSLTKTRANLAADCARQGKPVAANADWEDLALCGSKQFKAGIAKTVLASLATTRASIAADKRLDSGLRRQVLAEVDAAMRSVDRELRAN
jgi:beta-lactamase regulating signal transducer with metallopeptidase domain